MDDSNIYFMESQQRIADIKLNPVQLAVINASVGVKDLFTRNDDYLTTSHAWQQKLLISSKPYTVAGVDIKSLAAQTFSITAKNMSGYGVKINDTTLIGLKSLSYSKLYKKTPTALHAECENILALISLHSAGLVDYNIDAAFTAMLVTLAKDMKNLTKLPAAVIAQHANDYKEYMLHEDVVRKFYDTEMDPVMGMYKLTNMTLYLAYLAARRVRHHHMKHKPIPVDPETTTGILELLLLFKDSMEPAAGVNLVVSDLNISEISDAEGETYNDLLAPGTYHAKLSMDGYKSIEFDFTIEAGKTCAMQFLMEVV